MVVIAISTTIESNDFEAKKKKTFNINKYFWNHRQIFLLEFENFETSRKTKSYIFSISDNFRSELLSFGESSSDKICSTVSSLNKSESTTTDILLPNRGYENLFIIPGQLASEIALKC